MSPDPATLPESQIAAFLRAVGTGRLQEACATLTQLPGIVNAIGPHPFWGGRPQPLHVAIETSRRDMFELLLEHGADVDGRNDQYDHWSPLMLAIQRNQQDMIDELRRRGAHSGLLETLLLGDENGTEVLLRSSDALAVCPHRDTILAFARTPFAIDRLLALGAKADVLDRWGSTPIDAISRLGPPAAPLVRHLDARGLPVTVKHFARIGDLVRLTRLIEQDPDLARLEGVMLAAVDSSHHEMVQWLLERGANVNARADAPSRHSALHSAAWNGDLKMTQLLVSASADVYARDDQYNATPLEWALTSVDVSNNPQCAKVAEYLKSLNAE